MLFINVKADSREPENKEKTKDEPSVESSDLFSQVGLPQDVEKEILRDPYKNGMKIKYPTVKYTDEYREKLIQETAEQQSIHPSEVILLEADNIDSRIAHQVADRPQGLEPELLG